MKEGGESSWAAIITYCSLDGLNNRNSFSYSSRGWEALLRSSRVRFLVRGLLLALGGHLLLVSSLGLPSVHAERVRRRESRLVSLLRAPASEPHLTPFPRGPISTFSHPGSSASAEEFGGGHAQSVHDGRNWPQSRCWNLVWGGILETGKATLPPCEKKPRNSHRSAAWEEPHDQKLSCGAVSSPVSPWSRDPKIPS